MRIVSWNIRAGGGERVQQIAEQLRRWRTDVIALSEFRATPPSHWLSNELRQHGFIYQCQTTDASQPAANRLLVASRWPLRLVRRQAAPAEPGRWLLVAITAPHPLYLAALHVPNRVSGRKYPFLDAALAVIQRWRDGPALLVGDTNSGRIGLDEEVPAFNKREDRWVSDLEAAGWADAFRHQHGDQRAYTWYSPNGRNGFRLDQAFINRALLAHLQGVRYEWGRPDAGRARRDALSDHAALIVDLDLS